MSYSFKPMNDDELYNILEDGVYDFEVLKSVRKVSKAGNAMAEIQLGVWDKKGKIVYIRDYLIFSEVPLNIKKVKHFCITSGRSEAYEKGELPEDLTGFSGKAKVAVQEPQLKNGTDNEYWPKKNIVADYVNLKSEETKKVTSLNNEFNDDIGF